MHPFGVEPDIEFPFLFFVDISTISKVARHLVMENKNENLLQLEMGKCFQGIVTIFMHYCERFEPRSHFISTFTQTVILSLLQYEYLYINCSFRI